MRARKGLAHWRAIGEQSPGCRAVRIPTLPRTHNNSSLPIRSDINSLVHILPLFFFIIMANPSSSGGYLPSQPPGYETNPSNTRRRLNKTIQQLTSNTFHEATCAMQNSPSSEYATLLNASQATGHTGLSLISLRHRIILIDDKIKQHTLNLETVTARLESFYSKYEESEDYNVYHEPFTHLKFMKQDEENNISKLDSERRNLQTNEIILSMYADLSPQEQSRNVKDFENELGNSNRYGY